jgi:hypothetical protein
MHHNITRSTHCFKSCCVYVECVLYKVFALYALVEYPDGMSFAARVLSYAAVHPAAAVHNAAALHPVAAVHNAAALHPAAAMHNAAAVHPAAALQHAAAVYDQLGVRHDNIIVNGFADCCRLLLHFYTYRRIYIVPYAS